MSTVDCDLDWLVSQAIIVMDTPDEFIAPGVMASTMNKVSNSEQKMSDRHSLVSLAKKLKITILSNLTQYKYVRFAKTA